MPPFNAPILSEQSRSDISTTSGWGYVSCVVWAAQLQRLLWANIAIALRRIEMKKIILVFLTALVIAGTAQLTMGSDSLNRIARADIEKALRRELSPLLGVFDHVAFKLDNDGTVTLLGQVREPALKTQLEEDTMKVAGIKRVRNQIEVLPPLPSDDEIRTAVYNAIYSQNGLARYRLRAVPPIYIIVKNGFVTLEGVAANKLERAQVIATANDVPGVFSVKNNLHTDKGK
jgi:hyperosmotically inducible periplasmic protein